MALTGRLIEIKDIDNTMREEMLGIMKLYYENVNEKQFHSDLNEKDAVILICDEEEKNVIRGFSTQKLFDHTVNGTKMKILFSGDTIIEEQFRNSMALPIAWGRMMLEFEKTYPDTKIYWFLTTKGYKTYRFLPVFFKEFYPRYDCATPEFESEVLYSLGKTFFPEKFNPATLILRGGDDAQRLSPGTGHITQSRLKDPHISFFYTSNPNYHEGDELMTIALCSHDNIKDFIARRL